MAMLIFTSFIYRIKKEWPVFRINGENKSDSVKYEYLIKFNFKSEYHQGQKKTTIKGGFKNILMNFYSPVTSSSTSVSLPLPKSILAL